MSLLVLTDDAVRKLKCIGCCRPPRLDSCYLASLTDNQSSHPSHPHLHTRSSVAKGICEHRHRKRKYHLPRGLTIRCSLHTRSKSYEFDTCHESTVHTRSPRSQSQHRERQIEILSQAVSLFQNATLAEAAAPVLVICCASGSLLTNCSCSS